MSLDLVDKDSVPQRDPVKRKAYCATWREKNRERCRPLFLKYREDPKRRMHILVGCAALRAKRSGLAFESELYVLYEAAPPTHCVCCGCTLDYSSGKGVNNRGASPSFDRIDNEKGYTVENTRVLCFRCNYLKNDVRMSELGRLESIIRYMRSALN